MLLLVCKAVAYALLESLHIVRNAIATFDDKCVRLIKAHPDNGDRFDLTTRRPRQMKENPCSL